MSEVFTIFFEISMAYFLSKTPCMDSVLLTSCQTQNKLANSYINETSDYWNIDDILAEEELIPCKFKEDGKNLGHLDTLDQNVKLNKQQMERCEGAMIKKDTKIDLPLWLGIVLA
jgi:hypothetical protein